MSFAVLVTLFFFVHAIILPFTVLLEEVSPPLESSKTFLSKFKLTAVDVF